MKGQTSAVIARGLDKIALIERPHAQLGLIKVDTSDDNSARGTPGYAVSLDVKSNPVGADRANTDSDIATAIEVAVGLLRSNDRGDYITAEEFLNRLGGSPDAMMTSGALAAAGEGQPAYSTGASFYPSSFGKFPRHLESQTEYRMLLSDFADVCPTTLKAGFQRLHQSGVSEETRIDKLLLTRRRLPVSLSGSPDALLFRVAASAGVELDAIVTLTVSTRERTIIGYTLIRLSDPQKTLGEVQELLSGKCRTDRQPGLCFPDERAPSES
jgi:hypothetical protein